MGCCTSNTETIHYKCAITEVEENNDFSVLSSNGRPSIDDPVTIIDNVILNPLALSLYLGLVDSFRYSKEVMGASLNAMNELLEKQGTSAFKILFEKGHFDFLRYFLPFYLMSCDQKLESIELLKEPLILIAVKNRHLKLVSFVHSYFSQVCPPPAFDLHSIEQETGENSALIACRNLDLGMAVFLNETCKVNFHIINKKDENALVLSALNSTIVHNSYEFIKYLVEVVRVDTRFRYQFVIDSLCEERIKEIIVKFDVNDRCGISESFSRISSIVNKEDDDWNTSIFCSYDFK